MTKKHKNEEDLDISIAVVGTGGVGKSALSLQFVQHLFVDEYDPTIQDNYVKKICINDKWYNIDILDTAGQDEFSSLRHQYMQKYEGFLLVYSVTCQESLEELKDLHKEILRAKCTPGEFTPREKVPMLMVGNKSDLNSVIDESSLNQIVHNFGNIDTILTSAKKRENVDECFTKISELVIACRNEREVLMTDTGTKGCKCQIM